MKNKEIIFNTPKNFKRGKYPFSKYRPSDLIIILSTIAISISLIVAYLNFFSSDSITNIIVIAFILLPVMIVYFLYLPMPTYFNLLDFLIEKINFSNRQKTFKWDGIYHFNKGDEHVEK